MKKQLDFEPFRYLSVANKWKDKLFHFVKKNAKVTELGNELVIFLIQFPIRKCVHIKL